MTYPTFPSGLIITNVVTKHFTPNFASTSLNKKTTARSRGIHRLEGSFDVYIQDERDQRRFEAFLLQVQGRLSPFYMRFGGARFSATDVNGTPSLAVATSIADTTISLKTLTGTIRAGDFFSLPNDDKVYMFMEDRTSPNLTGIPVFPAIRTAQPIDTVVTVEDVPVLARLQEDIQTITYGNGGLIHTATLNWVESLV